jgi:hypothetical protein
MTRARSRSKPRLRSKIRRELWRYSKLAGEAAWEWAKAQPEVQKQLKKVETKIEQVKERTQVHIERAEREFWAWVERLEADGYIENPQRPGPSITACYERLGVLSSASNVEVKRAWREKMVQYHPDRFANDPVALKDAETKARELNEAYQAIRQIRGI